MCDFQPMKEKTRGRSKEEFSEGQLWEKPRKCPKPGNGLLERQRETPGFSIDWSVRLSMCISITKEKILFSELLLYP